MLSSGGMRVWTLQRPAPLTRNAAEHGSDARQRNAKRSFAGRVPKRSLGTTEDEVFARHRGIIAGLGRALGRLELGVLIRRRRAGAAIRRHAARVNGTRVKAL